MEYKFEYFGQLERQTIIETNSDKYLIAEHNIADGNFLIFTDIKPVGEEIREVRLEMARGNSELFETMIMLLGGAV